MTMTCIILFITAFLLALAMHETSVPPPRFVTKIFCLFEKCSFCFGGNFEDGNGDETNIVAAPTHAKSKCLWAPVAKALRCLIFVIFLCLYIFVIIGCFAG